MRWGALAAALLVAIFVGWLGFQGLSAKSNLEQAQDSAQQAKDALLSGKSEDATRFAESAQFHAHRARAATHSLPWNVAAAVPFLGSPLRTTQQISDVVVGLADGVLLPGATMGAGLSPDKLIDGTRINLKLLRDEEPRLSELSVAAAKLDAEARSIADPAYLSLIRDARSQLQTQTARLAQLLHNTALAAQLAPSMLGADGPRSYLVGFESPAEARGTGGLLGGFAVVDFDDGKPIVDALGQNTELREASASIDLGPEFNKVYGWMNPTTDFRNSNMSPHFPYAAQIWKSMVENGLTRAYTESAPPPTGLSIDGVIATDPIALSYILGAIGPVTLPDGEVINQDNVVELTLSTAYVRFPGGLDNTYITQRDRKAYLQNIAGAVVEKMTGPVKHPRKLLDALGRAAAEGRIAVWSSSPAEQQLLEETPLAHAVPDDDAPYAQVVINNLAGNKMDYYLKREIEYVADGCDSDMRNSTITVRLTNTVGDMQLPDYVAATPGLAPGLPLKVPNGTMVSSVRLLATKGARLMSVTSNGERTTAIRHLERGRPSFEVQVAIPPGKSGELVFRLSEPTNPGAPRVPVQPLVDSVAPRVSVPVCG
ncbi:DUF4012 domain-containing protein [Mycolicibacterium sp.]|uniref:DUF4012 domain-containing protein n=1 Tax=Mycolicibacterium sp. TaxID=2320850 RepID=UPI0025DB41B9|nr:DUF4012 domain-containing protein [Mycolicibacterium sp.]MCB9409886.1 DUF4012 domain-containing protein [Mycolicibacterium sp.]